MTERLKTVAFSLRPLFLHQIILPLSVWPKSVLANLRVIRLWKYCRSREQIKLSIRSRSSGHNLQTSLRLLTSVKGRRIHGNHQSHTALCNAQTPSMGSLQCNEDYPRARQRLPNQAPRHFTECCNDVRPTTFCFLISCSQHAYQSFFITGVWTWVWLCQCSNSTRPGIDLP